MNAFEQSDAATEIARRASEEASVKQRPLPRKVYNVDMDALLDAVRPMVARYRRDQYKGNSVQWKKLERLLFRGGE